MGNIADQIEAEMRCPRCGEFSDFVTDSVMFPDERCCPACDEIEVQRHLDIGCKDPMCDHHLSAPGGL